MAIHDFVCDDCGVVVQDTQTKTIHVCPKCGKDMRFDCHVMFSGAYKHPIHSDSLAVPEHQRAEHERKFPYMELDSECRPVFDNFQKHERYLKETGFIKNPQKIKPKSERIA